MRQELVAAGPAKEETAETAEDSLGERAEPESPLKTEILQTLTKASVLSEDQEEPEEPQPQGPLVESVEDRSWAWLVGPPELRDHTTAEEPAEERAHSVTEGTEGITAETEKMVKDPELVEAEEPDRISEHPETAETGMME